MTRPVVAPAQLQHLCACLVPREPGAQLTQEPLESLVKGLGVVGVHAVQRQRGGQHADAARGHGHAGAKHEAPATVLNSLMGVVRVAGKIGIPGLYVTEDPGAVDAAAKMGSLSIRFGLGWAKSHSFHTGQTPVMKYNRALMQAIMWDRINIAEVVGVQVISLDDAPRGYGEFDAGVPKKFVIDPHKLFSAA